MRNTVIWPYNVASESARLLAEALHIRRLRHTTGPLPARVRTIINWGGGHITRQFGNGVRVINREERVRVAANKLLTLRALHRSDVRVPPYTTSHWEAQLWADRGDRVLVRNLLTSSEGRGIEICEGGSEVPRGAPLYTKYIQKRHEYRVHCLPDGSYFVARKLRRNGAPSSYIRNTANGYVFSSHVSEYPEDVVIQARRAVSALGLDFGAVDVIFSDRLQQAFVLEVNTAPGIEGSTVAAYAAAFQRMEA